MVPPSPFAGKLVSAKRSKNVLPGIISFIVVGVFIDKIAPKTNINTPNPAATNIAGLTPETNRLIPALIRKNSSNQASAIAIMTPRAADLIAGPSSYGSTAGGVTIAASVIPRKIVHVNLSAILAPVCGVPIVITALTFASLMSCLIYSLDISPPIL